jgi:hypothetical protein
MSQSTGNARELFERWYIVPLRWLEAIPNGDGAFVAFAISLALYERFARSAIKANGEKADTSAVTALLAQHFEITDDEAKVFWQIMRDGMQHQGMPMQQQRGESILPWRFSGSFSKPIQFASEGSERVLQVQPWLFRDAVLRLYRERPDLIDVSRSFPWATIFPSEPTT